MKRKKNKGGVCINVVIAGIQTFGTMGIGIENPGVRSSRQGCDPAGE